MKLYLVENGNRNNWDGWDTLLIHARSAKQAQERAKEIGGKWWRRGGKVTCVGVAVKGLSARLVEHYGPYNGLDIKSGFVIGMGPEN